MNSRVIVITGASSGIGATLARRLGAAGHRLVLAARDPETLGAAARNCGNAVAVPTDVTKRAEVERLCAAAITAFGQVDVWVNNAGRGITRDVLDLTDDDLDEMMRINTKSALYGMQAIVPHFKSRREGHVVNVSTMLSRVPSATFRAAYSAAKAALNVLTASLRMDLQAAYPDIHVSLVLPGAVPTNFQKNAIGEVRPPSGPSVPQTAEEVAAVIAGVIEAPAAETYTSQELLAIAQRYQDDVGAFERALMNASPRGSAR
jgi:short-subunit dehydrogenase